jgi:tRNA U55 pseudouridine synthase TruB
VRNGSLHVDDAAEVVDLEFARTDGTVADRILSPSRGLADLTQVEVSDELAAGIRNGLSFPAAVLSGRLPESGPVGLVDTVGDLLAVYRVRDGKVSPEVVIT